MKKFRAAIIGCGGIAGVHEQVLNESGNCEIAACVDIIPERAKEMAARTGCPAYTDMQEMLEKVHPDTVHICTPHYLHVQQIKAAAEKEIDYSMTILETEQQLVKSAMEEAPNTPT